MKVLILVTLLTLSSAHEGFLKDIHEQLDYLSKASDLTIVNGTQLHSIPEKHPCECEVVFVQNLHKSIGLISSKSHQEHLYNIMDMASHLLSMKDLTKEMHEVLCETVIRRKRASKLNLAKIYLNSNIAFIKKWNKANCKKNSAFKHIANRKQQ